MWDLRDPGDCKHGIFWGTPLRNSLLAVPLRRPENSSKTRHQPELGHNLSTEMAVVRSSEESATCECTRRACDSR